MALVRNFWHVFARFLKCAPAKVPTFYGVRKGTSTGVFVPK